MLKYNYTTISSAGSSRLNLVVFEEFQIESFHSSSTLGLPLRDVSRAIITIRKYLVFTVNMTREDFVIFFLFYIVDKSAVGKKSTILIQPLLIVLIFYLLSLFKLSKPLLNQKHGINLAYAFCLHNITCFYVLF